MSISIRVVGPKPAIRPARLEEGVYTLEPSQPVVARSLLPRFGLDEPGVSYFVNGRPAGPETLIRDGDAVDIVLLVMGG